MKIRTAVLAPMFLAAIAGIASGQSIITQWTFNNLPVGTNNSPAPSTGLGKATPLGFNNNYTFSIGSGVTGSIASCDILAATGSTDPVAPSSNNRVWRPRGAYFDTVTHAYIAGISFNLAAPQFTQGAQFDVSTLNYSNITVTFDWFSTNFCVKNMQPQYTLDGVNWINYGPGLVAAPNAYINNNTFDFTSIPAANDNPKFGMRFVSKYDPALLPAPGYASATNGAGGVSVVYNNASGNWRYDMVTVKGTAIRAIGPVLSQGESSPSAVCANGGTITLTVNAQPGANPASTGIAVSADLSPLGLSATQAFRDDGTNGDLAANDGIFTYVANVPSGRTVGPLLLNASITDAQSRTGSTTIPVQVGDCSGNSAANVVISETFAGGGRLGEVTADDAPYDSDFVQLYNRSSSPVNLDGWSVQYASPAKATGFDTTDDQVLLSGIIQPGQTILVRMSDPVPGFGSLPTPDFAQKKGLGGMGNTGGRVALVRSSTLLGTDYTRSDIEDFVGYGTGVLTYEGAAPAPTPAPSSSNALFRKSTGSQDTNQNFNDFTNARAAAINRTAGGFLAGYAAVSPVAVCAGSTTKFTVAVTPGTGSTGISVSADVSDIVGSPASVTLVDNGTNGDAVPNDGIYSLDYTVPGIAAQGTRTINFTVADAQGHSDVSKQTLAVANCGASLAPVVISKIYGGGGNDGSGFQADFIEIFNRSSVAVNLTGWSIQSARISEPGFDTRIGLLSGIIGPGEYRLMVTNNLSSTGAVLPPADFTPASTFGLESSFGRVALVSTADFVHSDYTRADVVDLVGYGSLSQSFEGVAPTESLGDIFVAVRKDGGCQDTNQNAIDFDVVLALDQPFNSSSPTHTCASPVCPCVADFDGSGGTPDASDIDAYFAQWLAGDPSADSDCSGGTPDASDIDQFFTEWLAGGC